jgi:peptide/nickel transport system substrate-binding protein
MSRNRLMLAFGLLLAVSLMLAACGPKPTVTPSVPTEPPPPTTPAFNMPACVAGTGAAVDSVVFTGIDQADAAVTQLQAGQVDLYAYTVSDPTLFATVKADPNLGYTSSFGSYNEMTFNPAVFTDTTRLNPFSNPKIREATNYLIDRTYVSQEIFGGLAVPKFTLLNSSFADYARFVDVSRAIEAKYAYNLEKGNQIITTEMLAMGATKGADGKWMYSGAPVSLIILIRTEDKRKDIGDYFSNQLEAIGFTVDRQYKTRSEASPIWVRGNPTDGLFNIYTGGWVTTAISRDQGTDFSFYYTKNDYPIPLFQAYTNSDAFEAVALALRNNDFNSLDERAQLFREALPLSLESSQRIWVVDQISFSPAIADLAVTYDLAGGVAGSQLWPYTINFKSQDGGTVRWAQPGVLVDPWNPIAGSNWVYDMSPIRATADWGAVSDPYTGLAWPQRIEKAEVYAVTGLPIASTLPWVTLQFVDAINVPADAWLDWDPIAQTFIPAGEGTTAKVRSVVYYPADLWNVKWHDGSPLTIGDFVMGMIMTFDPGSAGSAIYDPSSAATLDAYKAHFKGVKILSTNPLVIETYDDLYALDAENTVTTWYPQFTYGPGSWPVLAIGNLAEANRELAYSADKADKMQTEWMSLIAGPSLDILKAKLDQAQAETLIPFAATMSTYVTPEEAALRYANLQTWYANRGTFWLGTGPFYLDSVYPVEGSLTIKCNGYFLDATDKWSRFAAPKLALTEVTGPAQVTIGSEATFDVAVTYEGAPYPAAELSAVKFLLFDAGGSLISSGDATMVSDGQYQVVLPVSVTTLLAAGSNKLEVAVTSILVSIPSFGSAEFVTVAP